jgi:hypothetical protein
VPSGEKWLFFARLKVSMMLTREGKVRMAREETGKEADHHNRENWQLATVRLVRCSQPGVID